jgi:hypothetical protein
MAQVVEALSSNPSTIKKVPIISHCSGHCFCALERTVVLWSTAIQFTRCFRRFKYTKQLKNKTMTSKPVILVNNLNLTVTDLTVQSLPSPASTFLYFCAKVGY